MILPTLDQLLEYVGVDINLAEKTITLNLPGVHISHISFRTVKAMSEDPGTVSNILSKCFIQRRVMWQDFRSEKAEDCKKSIDEMKDILEDKAREFRKTGKAKDDEYADLLEAWANECVDASKSFREAIDTEQRDREAYQRWELPESSDIQRASISISEILGRFRLRTYLFVDLFIQLLQKNSKVKKQVLDKIDDGKSLLVQAYGISYKQIATLEWGI